ncbi:MAG: cell division protein FtsX [Eubacteriales bacterium]
MKHISTFFYHVGQGFTGVFRNPVMSTASMLVLICCMLITGTFYLVIDNINRNFKALDDLNVMIVWIDDDTGDSDVSADESTQDDDTSGSPADNRETAVFDEETLDAIRALDHVTDVYYVSKQEAFDELVATEGSDADFLQYFDADTNNPLRASYRLTFESGTDTENIRYIKSALIDMGFDKENISENIDLYDNLNNVKGALTTVALWLMAILFVVSLFVIMNSIRLGLFSRREEIQIMRYVGATNAFIRTPFVFEGIIIGLISAIIALGLQYYLYAQVISEIVRKYSVVDIAPFGSYLLYIGAGFAVIGVFAGIFGSLISIRKYLKV